MTQEPSRSGQDPIGDFQRWLVRSGARSVSREVSDQIRSMLGVGGGPADVWARATAPPADEAPECAWCPFCRAARVLRESGPGVSSQMGGGGLEAVSGVALPATGDVQVGPGESGPCAATGAGGQGWRRAGTGTGHASGLRRIGEPRRRDPAGARAGPGRRARIGGTRGRTAA